MQAAMKMRIPLDTLILVSHLSLLGKLTIFLATLVALHYNIKIEVKLANFKI